MSKRIQSVAALWALVGFILISLGTEAADKAKIQQAIARGAGFIKQKVKEKSQAEKSLAYLSIYKAGEAADGPLMQEAASHVLNKFKDGAYHPSADEIYEAGVDASLLSDLDKEKYRPQLQIIADFISSNQSPEGHWNYLPPRRSADRMGGDVSVTHYACLGLWAAARADVPVDPQVWVRVLNWINSNHNSDGGYAYNPGQTLGKFGKDSTLNMSVNAVGIMCIAMMQLEPKRLPSFEKGMATVVPPAAGKSGEKALDKTAVEKEAKKPMGALEAVDLDKIEAEKGQKAFVAGRIPEATFASTKNALHWVATRFDTVNRLSDHAAYYYYSLERMGALANITKLEGRDWYNECAEELLSTQKADGSWAISTYGGPDLDTCFAVLFLTRSTGKILKRTTTEPPVGGGLLSGGRGLPDDLSEVDANGNVKKKKEKSSLDDLISSLQNTEEINLEETQAELVQQIQLGDKKQLVGQKDKLLKLVEVPNPEVRRTAIWAIGRTGDLSLAKFALLGLSDPDAGVMRESHLALCWTARKPNAFKLPLDPLEGLPMDAGTDQKSAAIESWRRQALRLWGEWYLRNRPYNERGDEFETNLRNKLLELK